MVLSDGAGTPLGIYLANGAANESPLLIPTLKSRCCKSRLRNPIRFVLADKAYSGAKLRHAVQKSLGIEIVSPKKKNSKDKIDGRTMRRYNGRWVIERTNAWLLRFRRVSTRYERSADLYLGIVTLACITILLRSF